MTSKLFLGMALETSDFPRHWRYALPVHTGCQPLVKVAKASNENSSKKNHPDTVKLHVTTPLTLLLLTSTLNLQTDCLRTFSMLLSLAVVKAVTVGLVHRIDCTRLITFFSPHVISIILTYVSF